MLIAFAFFVLATRMHERYIFGAFLLAFPLLGSGRRYWTGRVFSPSRAAESHLLVRLPNRDGSPHAGRRRDEPVAGRIASDRGDQRGHSSSTAGYLYLGGSGGRPRSNAMLTRDRAARARVVRSARRRRRDDAAATGRSPPCFTLASFVVCSLVVQWPRRENLRRDLLRARGRRVSQTRRDLRVHASAADQARRHALDAALRRPARRRSGLGLALPQRRDRRAHRSACSTSSPNA